MSDVIVKINNKPYTIGCDEGQEERVQQLGQYVAQQYGAIAQSGAGMNEMQNMVLTSILLADEIAELRDYISALETERGQAGLPEPRVEIREVIKEVIKEVPVEVRVEVPAEGTLSDDEAAQMAEMIADVSRRIGALSNKLAKAA